MLDVHRNNLDRAISPYLRQHTANPIWWQEWSPEVIEKAQNEGTPLFVSVGYATCHWCHVMAAEAFSHEPTAEYLNRHFLSIKIDREQRPDIDQYLMRFITEQTGCGGWPLNVFLTPRLSPIYACTYCPAVGNSRMPSLLQIAQAVYAHYAENGESIPPYSSNEQLSEAVDLDELPLALVRIHDSLAGGFGRGQKFPPHTTLLFLLYYLCAEPESEVKSICIKTLDAMRLRGLHDHLQGGIFRYCVDREWTIPHFEKMLYDQAMALWNYALAYKVFRNDAYKIMALQIVRCLEETFTRDGLFISGHDADAEHREGASYLWRYDELVRLLTPDELAVFRQTYRDINKTGNFEGAIHLVRKTEVPLRPIEDKLLAVRRARTQPRTDDKILCGINALTAAAFAQAARLMDMPSLEARSAQIVHQLLSVFWDGRTLAHSLFEGTLQKQNFLFDAAAILFAVSLLRETDSSWHDTLTKLSAYLESFRDKDGWLESAADDFHPVRASGFDHPIPSSTALAEMARTRVDILAGNPIVPIPYRQPFEADFYNIVALIRDGRFHLIISNYPVDWSVWPANIIQVRGDPPSDCYRGACRDLPNGAACNPLSVPS